MQMKRVLRVSQAEKEVRPIDLRLSLMTSLPRREGREENEARNSVLCICGHSSPNDTQSEGHALKVNSHVNVNFTV